MIVDITNFNSEKELLECYYFALKEKMNFFDVFKLNVDIVMDVLEKMKDELLEFHCVKCQKEEYFGIRKEKLFLRLIYFNSGFLNEIRIDRALLNSIELYPLIMEIITIWRKKFADYYIAKWRELELKEVKING